MTVIVLGSSPPSVKGSLSRWMIEVSAGVYVGRLTARVREGLWQKIKESLPDGKALMVNRSSGEQGMEIRMHNNDRLLADFDGVWLVKKPMKISAESKDNKEI